jgi:hypothetical protein
MNAKQQKVLDRINQRKEARRNKEAEEHKLNVKKQGNTIVFSKPAN